MKKGDIVRVISISRTIRYYAIIESIREESVLITPFHSKWSYMVYKPSIIELNKQEKAIAVLESLGVSNET